MNAGEAKLGPVVLAEWTHSGALAGQLDVFEQIRKGVPSEWLQPLPLFMTNLHDGPPREVCPNQGPSTILSLLRQLSLLTSQRSSRPGLALTQGTARWLHVSCPASLP